MTSIQEQATGGAQPGTQAQLEMNARFRAAAIHPLIEEQIKSNEHLQSIVDLLIQMRNLLTELSKRGGTF